MRLILLITLSFLVFEVKAQESAVNDSIQVSSELKELQSIATAMISENKPETRKENCYKFIPALVKYLQEPNSFQIDLSTIPQISVLNAPDNSFRIITWALEESITSTGNVKTYSSTDELSVNPLKYTYFGAIQFNSEALKLIPLEDNSSQIKNPEDLMLEPSNWYGAIYYNISQFKVNDQDCYALFGWDGNTGLSTKKIMDIISFKDEKAIFGMPIIEIFRDGTFSTKTRFIHEFRSGSGVSLNWDEERNMVIYDFIEPPEPESKGIYPTYIPDGTYNGLKLEDNMWRYVERVYEGFEISPDQLLNDRQNREAESQKPKKRKRKKSRK